MAEPTRRIPSRSAAVPIHQCLFGYDRGHRMLASSVELPSSTARHLLIASDFPVRDIVRTGHGYLTGFPVEEAGVYAFSSTWAAPEMPRPGCVWTHTLLVPFVGLARIPELGTLLRMFRRPRDANDIEGYGLAIPDATAGYPGIEPDRSIEALALPIMTALYGSPERLVIGLTGEPATFDAGGSIACSIWSQQWPRLRRTFRFATRGNVDRATLKVDYDLLVAETIGSGALGNDAISPLTVDLDDRADQRMQEPIGDGQDPEAREWLGVGLADLVTPGIFRQFLKRYGSDTSGGRPAFATLALAYLALNRASVDTSALAFGMVVRDRLAGPREAATLKADILENRLVFSAGEDGRRFDWLASMFRQVPGSIVAFAPEPMAVALHESFARLSLERRFDLARSLNKDGAADWVGIVLDRLAMDVDASEALAGVDGDWGLYLRLARTNEALLVEPRALEVPGLREAVVAMLMHRDGDPRRLLDAVCFLDDAFIVGVIFERAPSEAMDRILEELHLDRTVPGTWMQGSFSRPAELVAALRRRHRLKRSVLVTILSGIGARSRAAREAGPDTWAGFLRMSKGSLDAEDRLGLSALLFSIAIDQPRPGSEVLLAFSFDSLHDAAARGSTSFSWTDLDSVLPGGWDYWAWDRCRRLRSAVCDAYLRGTLDPATFLGVTKSRRVFGDLSREMRWRWGGSTFLRRVGEAEVEGKKARRFLLDLESEFVPDG